MEILELFGVDWKLMVAQLVNFAIVVLVLWFFAIKPLMKTMEGRNKEIEKGLDDAQKAGDRLQEVEKEIYAKMLVSKEEAIVILDKAKKQAEGNKKESIDKTKEEIVSLIDKAKKQIEGEKKVMMNDIKKETVDLITISLEKILAKGLNKDIDKKYIEQTFKDLK